MCRSTGPNGNWLKGHTNRSLSVKTSWVKSRTWMWWRILGPDHMRRSHCRLSETQCVTGVENREREKRSDEQIRADVFT